MKIVQEDNFSRDSVSDILIAENVTEHWARNIAVCLNKKFSGSISALHFRAVPDDYKLYKFVP